MFTSVSGSMRNIETFESVTKSSALLSFSPSQSATRQEIRNLGRSNWISVLRILSRGIRPSGVPARISSSPSMNRVFPRTSSGAIDCSRKSLAVTNRASSPRASLSAWNAVVLPEPGSPSNTYACRKR